MKHYYLVLLALAFIIQSCQNGPGNNSSPFRYNYGTSNDSALYHYNKGWELIMDYGQWTASEVAFRKAAEMDPNFLIAKSLVGKITHNTKERKEILRELENQKTKVSDDDQLLLEITLATLKLMNARDDKVKLDTDFYNSFYALGETNYREFIHKHPHEDYMKAEYIEFLHRQYGPQQTLDSLKLLTNQRQKKLPFFVSYSALLHSELGSHKLALQTADQLQLTVKDPLMPQPYVTYAQVYANMDSLKLAKYYIDKAVRLDSNHVIAKRIKYQLEKDLQ